MQPAALLNAKPRERIQAQGMARESVGGNGPSRIFATEDIKPERGITVPLTVTAASQEIIPADANRTFLFIQNNDPLGIVYVSFGGDAAAVNQGFRLAPGGGAILLDNHVPTARVHMIGSIANNPNVTSVSA